MKQVLDALSSINKNRTANLKPICFKDTEDKELKVFIQNNCSAFHRIDTSSAFVEFISILSTHLCLYEHCFIVPNEHVKNWIIKIFTDNNSVNANFAIFTREEAKASAATKRYQIIYILADTMDIDRLPNSFIKDIFQNIFYLKYIDTDKEYFNYLQSKGI